MLIVNRATSFEDALVMSVSGRFDDTDIVHVITENLFVDSDPGGLFDPAAPSPADKIVDWRSIPAPLSNSMMA